MKTQIRIFEQGKGLGIFSSTDKFYPELKELKQRQEKFKEARLKLGKKLDIDGNKIFQPYQKTNNNNLNYKDGKYIVLDEEYMQKEDYWEERPECDILIISNKYPNIIVGNQTADCPILIIEDRKKGVTALSHCGSEYIDRNIVIDTIKALQIEYNSNLDDLYVYISSCIHKDSYIYETYPKWANQQKLWKKYIIKELDGYHIDLLGAIIYQLKNYGITHIDYSNIDNCKDDNYYSHYASVHGNKEKLGQNFVGFYYLSKK